ALGGRARPPGDGAARAADRRDHRRRRRPLPADPDPKGLPMTPLPLPRRALLATGLLGALGLGASACGGVDRPGSGGSDGAGADGTAGGDGSTGVADGFPLELDNCAEQLRLEAPPQRVVLLERSPRTRLEGIGVLDRVAARAGAFPAEYFTPERAARLEAIPALSEELDATGHLQINQEVVIAQQPDLV